MERRKGTFSLRFLPTARGAFWRVTLQVFFSKLLIANRKLFPAPNRRKIVQPGDLTHPIFPLKRGSLSCRSRREAKKAEEEEEEEAKEEGEDDTLFPSPAALIIIPGYLPSFLSFTTQKKGGGTSSSSFPERGDGLISACLPPLLSSPFSPPPLLSHPGHSFCCKPSLFLLIFFPWRLGKTSAYFHRTKALLLILARWPQLVPEKGENPARREIRLIC